MTNPTEKLGASETSLKPLAPVRQIRQPQAFDGAETQGYFMVAKHNAAVAILHKLTGTQMRLWLYLMMVDSFADYDTDGERIYHPLPSPAEIAIQIGISIGRVEKEMRLLRKLGLYDYRITAWQGHNLTSARARLESERLKQQKQATHLPDDSPPKLPTDSQQAGLIDGQNSPLQGQNSPQLQPADPIDGQNSPQNGQNSPQNGQNSPQESAETLDFTEISAAPQTLQTIQTLSDPETNSAKTERERQKNWQTDSAFRQWLSTKAKRLPEPPEFLEVWIDVQSQKESFQREYQASQRIVEQTNLPPPVFDRFQIESACLVAIAQNDRTYVRHRLQSLWEQGWQDLVSDLVQDYPGWGLRLGCSGVEEGDNG